MPNVDRPSKRRALPCPTRIPGASGRASFLQNSRLGNRRIRDAARVACLSNPQAMRMTPRKSCFSHFSLPAHNGPRFFSSVGRKAPSVLRPIMSVRKSSASARQRTGSRSFLPPIDLIKIAFLACRSNSPPEIIEESQPPELGMRKKFTLGRSRYASWEQREHKNGVELKRSDISGGLFTISSQEKWRFSVEF